MYMTGCGPALQATFEIWRAFRLPRDNHWHAAAHCSRNPPPAPQNGSAQCLSAHKPRQPDV